MVIGLVETLGAVGEILISTGRCTEGFLNVRSAVVFFLPQGKNTQGNEINVENKGNCEHLVDSYTGFGQLHRTNP